MHEWNRDRSLHEIRIALGDGGVVLIADTRDGRTLQRLAERNRPFRNVERVRFLGNRDAIDNDDDSVIVVVEKVIPREGVRAVFVLAGDEIVCLCRLELTGDGDTLLCEGRWGNGHRADAAQEQDGGEFCVGFTSHGSKDTSTQIHSLDLLYDY